MLRTILIYAAVLLVFGTGIFLTLEHGELRQFARKAPAVAATAGTPSPRVGAQAGQTTSQSPASSPFKDPLTQLLLQVILIIVSARLAGAWSSKWGQPAVIGEMVAGILLGPSLLGWLSPGVFQFVFPSSSLPTLRMFSQIGVCLFLFVIGMDLNVDHLRQKARTAVVVSHVSIVFPYFLGVLISVWLYPDLAMPGTDFISFALFMGISMSITAFPVLARILEDRGISKTLLGTTAIACAAVDDVTAWNVLAFVVAIAQAGGLGPSLLRVGLVAIFVGVMLWWVRPRLPRWLGDPTLQTETPRKGVLVRVLVLVLGSALATEILGIHALFGAFLAGVIMPRERAFCDFLKVRLENFSSVFLLPLFFAFTGLRTQMALLNDVDSWLICLAIVITATIGKLGGSMIAARVTGMAWGEAFALGALMNTRGLMELIALNIGYDLGILSPRIFAMLVLMALVTTLLTGPLLTLARLWTERHALVAEAAVGSRE